MRIIEELMEIWLDEVYDINHKKEEFILYPKTRERKFRIL